MKKMISLSLIVLMFAMVFTSCEAAPDAAESKETVREGIAVYAETSKNHPGLFEVKMSADGLSTTCTLKKEVVLESGRVLKEFDSSVIIKGDAMTMTEHIAWKGPDGKSHSLDLEAMDRKGGTDGFDSVSVKLDGKEIRMTPDEVFKAD